MLDARFDPARPFTDAELCEVEKLLGRELPESYRAFLKQYGGAFVGGSLTAMNNFQSLLFLVLRLSTEFSRCCELILIFAKNKRCPLRIAN